MLQRCLGDFSFSTNKGQGHGGGLCTWVGRRDAEFFSVPGIICFPEEMIDSTLLKKIKEKIFLD